jgi:predicted transcriptional regulator
MVSTSSVISAISDEKALSLFKAVALSENDCSHLLISKLRLSRRQYYSTMMALMEADLVRRISGRYSLTSLGKIMFNSYLKMETAIKYYWKLKAIDSILTSAINELPMQECTRIIDKIIDNNEIKALLNSDTGNQKEQFKQRSFERGINTRK